MFHDALAMADAIRQKEVSSLELVNDSIANIEKMNPKLNAVVSKQYEEAREKAKTLKDKGQPFLGVPFLLKDLGQNQAGQLSTSGSKLFANYRAQRSDYLVEVFESLGFIVLGRTNTPEFGFKNISDSRLHGAVNLPQDVTRNAGGSSGGSAAAVASGMVPIAGASDGGGSIRIPASFNGLIGLKPSRGRIPVGPDSYRGWQGASVNFALTKSVRDTQHLLYHTQRYQTESPFPLPRLSQSELFKEKWEKPLKIALLTASPIGGRVSDQAIAAATEAAKFLSDQGHEVTPLQAQPVDGVAAMKAYYIMNSVETAAMFDGIEASLGRLMAPDDMELMTWAIYQSGQTIPAKTYSHTLNVWDQFSAQMAHFHEEYDIVLTPTVADVAPKHGQFDLSEKLKDQLLHIGEVPMQEQQDLVWQMFADSLDWTPFTQQANLTGQPALSLPTYRRNDGLSIGVQLTAAKGREDVLLHLAKDFEDAGLLR
ncbi:amidase [Streptococcus moroccensis]|uniref:Amidase n=1 Tax=Streptococcus moroccensis TaxID=1451356 RepID=A0ABT9YSR0_9STRE|nr:amidase [Streptococcus moroccensis]MDQ0222155.1 amidase [Streptococcus moroccensis]